MNKTILFLLICLTPSFIGCMGGGGGGDGGGAAVFPQKTNATSVTLEAQVPTSVLNQSIRAALIPSDIQVSIQGVPLTYVSTTGNFMLFQATVSSTNASFSVIISQGGGEVDLTVQVGTKEPVTVKMTLDTTTDGSTTKTLTVTVSISTNTEAGTYTVEATGGPGVGPQKAPGQSGKSLGITAIEYLSASGGYLPLADATGVPYSGTTLRITFDSVVDNATNNFKITASSPTGHSVTLTQNDLGKVFEVTQTDIPATGTMPAYSYLTAVLLKNTVNGKKFGPSTKYTLTFESASVRKKNDPSVKLRPFTSLSRTFTTGTST